jgi:hypothetical protein
MAEITIPLGTKATLNGIEVEFATDAVLDVTRASSIDHAAEMGVENAFGFSLTHEEDGKEVSYVGGKRHERELPKPEKKESPKKEKTAPKKKG